MAHLLLIIIYAPMQYYSKYHNAFAFDRHCLLMHVITQYFWCSVLSVIKRSPELKKD